MKKIVILGSGGHSNVVIDILRAIDRTDFIRIDGSDEDEFLACDPKQFDMALGIGMPTEEPINGLEHRYLVANKFHSRGFQFPAFIHPSAVVSLTASVGDGAQVMAGAVLQPYCSIKPFAIVNTRASVDHDCKLGTGSHVAPGATLGGNVNVGEFSLVGIGATVLQGITIGTRSLVAGGAMVIRDVGDYQTVIGVPARPNGLHWVHNVSTGERHGARENQ